jgi:PEP-CTERM motif
MKREQNLSPRILSRCGTRDLSLARLAACATLLIAWAGTPVQAGFVEGSYQINIGESGRLLEAMVKEQRGLITHDQFTAIKMEEMWKSPSIRLVDRNRPAIVLQNISDPNTNNEISQFTIDIKQLGYEFGSGDFNPDPFAGALTFLTKYSDPGVTLSTTYGTVSDVDLTQDRTKLVLNIGGLTPGKSLIFRVDLDPMPLASVAYPDYRYVLLGADIEDGQGPATPAEISALFAAGEGANRMTTATEPAEFAPGMGQTFPGAGLLEAYHSQQNSNIYAQTGSTGTEVPEPATVLLLIAGLAGLSRCRQFGRYC